MNQYEEINIKQLESETDPFTEDRYRLFNKFIQKNAKFILDIGCNTGRGGTVLKSYDNNRIITGIDIVRDRIDTTSSKCLREQYSWFMSQYTH